MNIVSKLLLAAALLTAVTINPAQAALDELSAFSFGGTDVSTTLCYSVVSTYSKNGGQPLVTYLNVTSDKAASVVQLYSAGSPVNTTFTNSTVTLFVNSTNGFNQGSGIIVIRHWYTDTYERRVLTTSTGPTNLVVTVAPTVAVIPGDQIWPETTAGFIPCGVTTATALSLNGPGIIAGQRGKPLLLEVDCTTNGQINVVSGTYVP